MPVGAQSVRLHGWVDYRTHTGYALATGVDFAPQLVRWNLRQVGLTPARGGHHGHAADADAARGAGRPAPVDPAHSVLDTVLVRRRRPRPGPAREPAPAGRRAVRCGWVGMSSDGEKVTGYAAPPSDERAQGPVGSDDSGLRLWVDGTGLAHRAQVRTGDDWAQVDLGDADGVSLPRLPAVRR